MLLSQVALGVLIRIPGGFEVPQTCITSLPNGALFNASSAPAIDVPARPPPHELHEALGGRQDVDGLGHQHTVRWTRARTARCTSRTRAPAPPTTITPCSSTSAAARAKGASPLCVAFVRADRRPPLPPLLRLPPLFTAPTAPLFHRTKEHQPRQALRPHARCDLAHLYYQRDRQRRPQARVTTRANSAGDPRCDCGNKASVAANGDVTLNWHTSAP